MSRRGKASPKSNKSNKKDFDARFDAFLKESISSEESFDSAKINKFLEPSKSNKTPWWMNDDEDDDDIGANFGSGLTASGKSFIKKKQPAHSTPIRDEDKPGSVFNLDKSSEDKKPNGDKPTKSPDKPSKTKGKKEMGYKMKTRTSRGIKFFVQKAAKMIDSSVESGKTETPHKPGIDTMDEMRDKEKFFRDLEKNVDGTIDYGRLNQELSQTGTTLSPEGAAKTAATLGTLQDINEDEINTKSRHLTNQNTEEQDPSQKRPSMLSKVSLMDSLESTMNTTTSPKIGQGTLQDAKEELDEVDGIHEIGHTHVGTKTGTGFMGTNTSQEIEALHKALREVGLSPTIKTDSQHFDNSFLGNKSTSDQAELLQKILNGETDQHTGRFTPEQAKMLQEVHNEETDQHTGKQRNVEDILQEMEEIENRSKHTADGEYDEHLYDRHRSPKGPKSPRALERQRQIEEEAEEMRGFDLSPVHDSARGGYDSARGFEQSHTEDTEMYQPVTQVNARKSKKSGSVTDRGRSKKKESKERDTQYETTKQSPRKSSRRKKSPGESPMRSLSPRESKRRISPRRSTSKGDNRSNSLSPHKPDNRSRSFSPAKTGTTIKPKFAHVKSSGYGKKSPSKPSSAKDRMENDKEGKSTAKYAKTWSPADVTRQKIKGSVSPTFHKDIHEKLKEEDKGRISQLRASVDSFAQYITDHFSTSRDIPEVKYSTEEPAMSATWKGEKSGAEDLMEEGNKQWQDQWKEEKRLNSVLKSDMMAMEREYQRKLETQKLEFEEKIFNLKQENFVLGAKLPDSESVLKKKLGDGGLSNMSSEQLEKLEKEMKEQETLLAGYQQENKRLYDELKNVTKQTKQTESRMFKENQKMAIDIANLKTQLERKEEQLQAKGVITSLPAQQNIAAGNTDGVLGAGRIAHLESEVKEARRQEEIAKREFQLLQKSKKELEQHIDQLIKEREALRHKVEESKTLKSEEAQALEDKYVKEIERLNRKLKWYAENQKLLDADAKVLKQKEEEILKYKLRIEELQTETGRKMEENKLRSKERAADAKKIQDLQRQVKEMEQIIRRRHPNSLPALMMTAAVAPDDTGVGKTPTVVVLENRLKKLEMELESKDQEADKMIRAVEQKYNNIKTQYEDRIKDLEIQLAIYKRPDDGALNIYEHPHTHAAALQKEMDSMREKYKRQVLELQAEVSRLNLELNKPKKGVEVALKNELQASKDTEAELRKQIKSLQLEVENKSHELQVTNKSLERLRKEKTTSMMNGLNDLDKNKKQKGKGKNKGNIEETDADSGNIFVNNDREYEPQSFADKTHISDLLKENLYLKSQVEQLQLEVDHGKLDLHKSIAESESMTRKSREHFEEQIEALRSSHQKELQRILADQALEYSASKTAELQSKVDAQEEMKHFEAIQEKILQMEKRHERREEELQQIIRNAKHVATVQLDQESHKWKKVVEDKNLEIQKFRTELDSILEVLRLLQKQGVVIPVSSQVR
ncbi:hypothetical protein KUTeg_007710 [Tegillarca granosa]|uniref:Centrosomal protein of 162 kDa n=1 Tax=Tegillarca granosa TaxID=220873 RepID=A0ABQ9FE13_TEGGR|nr:hypothetical protein KUTeg_007710 [Tegillarca granosa]